MIRSFFRRLWHLITFPFRWIAKPFLKLRDFINYEPEDTPIADVFSRTIEEPSILIDHLEALRRHLLRAITALVLAVLLSTLFTKQALDWLAVPIDGIDQLQAIEVTESIGVFMRVSLLTGFVIALPYIGIEIFAFLNPGLRRRERILLLTSIPAATIMFLLGIAFTYFILSIPAHHLRLGRLRFRECESAPARLALRHPRYRRTRRSRNAHDRSGEHGVGDAAHDRALLHKHRSGGDCGPRSYAKSALRFRLIEN